MLWLSGWEAGVKLRNSDRHSFIAGPTIETAVVNVLRELVKGHISGYGEDSALAHFFDRNRGADW